jgi:hypothetical protein
MEQTRREPSASEAKTPSEPEAVATAGPAVELSPVPLERRSGAFSGRYLFDGLIILRTR